VSRAGSFPKLVILSAIVGLMIVGPLAGQASASHFRGGDISYQRSTGNNVKFDSTVTFRCTFFSFGSPSCPAAGATVDLGGSADLDFADGTAQDNGSGYTVVSSNQAEDNFTARKSVSHAFPDSVRRQPSISSCCTLSLLNNSSADYRLFTDLNFSVDPNSPKTGVPPVVNVGNSGNQTFTVPATDPGGQTLRWRLATDAESGGSQVNPPDYSINSTTGLVTFNTTGKAQGLYHSSIVIEALSGGNVVSATQTTFLIRVGQQTANGPPVYTAPTPADGTQFTVAPGSNLSVALRASDPDAGDTVDIVPGALPTGSTFNDTPANPVNGSFSFTPSAGQNGQDFVVNFTAQDGKGGSVFRSFTVKVRTAAGTAPGRMGGKGRINDTATASSYSGAADFAFVLNCTKASNPATPRQNPLEVRFGGFIYRMSTPPNSISTIGCSTTGAGRPAAGFDTMQGSAQGTLTRPNGTTVSATADFRFFDGGTGPNDRSRIVITDSSGSPPTQVLNIDGAPAKFPGSRQATGENTTANP